MKQINAVFNLNTCGAVARFLIPSQDGLCQGCHVVGLSFYIFLWITANPVGITSLPFLYTLTHTVLVSIFSPFVLFFAVFGVPQVCVDSFTPRFMFSNISGHPGLCSLAV